MAKSQKNEPFEEPPFEQIAPISRQHVAAMEAGIAEAFEGANMKQLMLRTVGRKSGSEHKVALPYWEDENGHRVIVASYAGAKTNPAWFVNLADKGANPEVFAKEVDRAYWAEAQVLDGDDYVKTWAALTADRAFYNNYQTRTERRIPLVRLVERRPA